MCNLNEIEIEMISAGCVDRNHYHDGPNALSDSQNWRGGGYGGQANGFVSNQAAAGPGLAQGAGPDSVSDGIIAGAAGEPLAFESGIVGSALSGGCFNEDSNQN